MEEIENQKQIRIRKPHPKPRPSLTKEEIEQERVLDLVAAEVGVIVLKSILEVQEAHNGD